MRILIVTIVVLLAAASAQTVLAKKVAGGVVPQAQLALVRQFLGDYEGQWDTELTEDPYDDISRYELKNPVLRLRLDDGKRLKVVFFLDRATAAAGEELDLLGFGCKSGVGDLVEFTVPKRSKTAAEEAYAVFDAKFDFVWGGCPSRVHAVASNKFELTVGVNPVEEETLIRALLLRRVRADNKLIAKHGGQQYEVKARPATPDPESTRPPPLEFCSENALGEEQCVQQSSQTKTVVLPLPLGSISAVWYTQTTPNIKVVKGMSLIYHKGAFRRIDNEHAGLVRGRAEEEK